MANDLILDIDFNISEAEAKQRKLDAQWEKQKVKIDDMKKSIASANDVIEQMKAEQASLKEKWRETAQEAGNLEYIIDKMQSFKAEPEEWIKYGSLENAQKKLKEYNQILNECNSQYDKVTAAIIKKEAEISRTNALLVYEQGNLDMIGAKILKNTGEVEEQTEKVEAQTEKVERQGRSWKKVNQHLKTNRSALDKNLKRIKELAKSALIFSVLTKVLTSMRNSVGEIFGKDKEIAQYWTQLKNNLTVIMTTLSQGVKPYITWILEKVIYITQVIQSVLSRALGKSTKEMQQMADNMKNTADNTKKAANEAKKATASFDTLQTANTSANSDSTADTSTSVSTSPMGEFSKEMQKQIDKIMTIISASLLAIGAILLFSGVAPGLGFGLMVIGALGLWAELSANWDTLPEKIKTKIAIITSIVSAALIALGAILLFTGANIPLGLGLIAVGAIGLAATLKTMWDTLPEKTKTTIATITSIVSVALLAVGAILLFTGANIPLGLGLIAVGAVGLVATLKTMWNSLPEKIQNTVQVIMAILGGALIVLGIILLFTGAGIGLGLGLVLAGSASLAAAVAANPKGFLSKVKDFVGKIGGFFSGLWDGIKKGFGAMVKGIIKIANKWIDGLNLLLIPLRGIIYGIAKAFGSDISFKDVAIPHIPVPKLATGAVIPGGKPFMAMLGDQRAGQTNIEAPLDTIVEAVKLAIGEPKFTIEATGSMAQFIKLLNLKIKQEQNRSSVF